MTGHIRVIAALSAWALTLSLAAASAQACSCQKEYMIKKHGTLSVLDLPERPEPAEAAAGAPVGTPVSAPSEAQPGTGPGPAPAGG